MSESLSQNRQSRVLDEVRRALGRSSTAAPAPLELFVEARSEVDASQVVARFTDEALAVRASVYFLNRADEAIERIGEICADQGATEVALSGAAIFDQIGLASALTARGISTITGNQLSSEHEKLVARLANCGVGVTASDYAIAETGTIVLSCDEQHALLVSLLPPVHIAVLRSSQIVASLDDVITRVNQERTGRSDACRSVSFITGPSRTSDVELTLSIGVHGPKELHVIIIEDVSDKP